MKIHFCYSVFLYIASLDKILSNKRQISTVCSGSTSVWMIIVKKGKKIGPKNTNIGVKSVVSIRILKLEMTKRNEFFILVFFLYFVHEYFSFYTVHDLLQAECVPKIIPGQGNRPTCWRISKLFINQILLLTKNFCMTKNGFINFW